MEIEEKSKQKKEDKVILKENSKNRNMINKLKDNPIRLQYLKDSFKCFTLLKKNVYLERKRLKLATDDILICSCIPCPENQLHLRPTGPQYSYNCGDRCLNRFTCTECDVDLCPCRELCKNRRFQKHQDSCIYPVRTGGKGWGLAAGEKIYKGQFIMQYIGEIFYTNSPLGGRRIQEYSKSTCTYLMKINSQELIDPTYKGNLARFINHSCEPNCITVKWNVLGENCIGIFSKKDIYEDEELSFDYQFDAYNTPLTKCLCGSVKCKEYLGWKPINISEEKWEEHLEQMQCRICNLKDQKDDDQLLLCDNCNSGFHMACLSPPKLEVPKDAWYCDECTENQKLLEEKEKDKAKTQKKQKVQERVKRRYIKKKILKHQQSSDSSSSSSKKSYDEDDEDHDHHDNLNVSSKNQEQEDQKNEQSTRPPILEEELSPQEKEDVKTSPQETRAKSDSQTRKETVISKKKSISNQIKTPNLVQELSQKNLQLFNMVELAQAKFKKSYENNHELQAKVANLNQNTSSQEIMKEQIQVNILEQKVVRKNASLMYQIGNKTSFEQVDSEQVDFFKKENDLTIIGNSAQISVFRDVFTLIEQIIKELKKEMGIVEGQIKIPTIFLKRLILNFNQLEQKHQVNILYHKQTAYMEEIFPLDKTTPLKIKGSKQSIESCVHDINNYIKSLTVFRLYISRSETKTVQQSMFYLKQTANAEIRISRDSVYRGEHVQRDINHPFFYIQFREKEVCLIGTEKQIEETNNAITHLLEKERQKESDKEVTYFTVLVHPQHKDGCKHVKMIMEKQSSSTKVLLFEASHPRKNLTILVLCLRTQIDQIKQQFADLIQQHCNINLEQFQQQMMMQMCRYVFKYLQNTFMTQEMAFMKNWDLITPYFFNLSMMFREFQAEENWFLKKCSKSLQKDFETQLYIQYILSKQITKNLSEANKNIRKKNILNLMRKILYNLNSQKKNHDRDRSERSDNKDQNDLVPLVFQTPKRYNSDNTFNIQQPFTLKNEYQFETLRLTPQISMLSEIPMIEPQPIILPSPPRERVIEQRPVLAKLVPILLTSDSSSSSQSSFSLKSSDNSEDSSSVSEEAQRKSSSQENQQKPRQKNYNNYYQKRRDFSKFHNHPKQYSRKSVSQHSSQSRRKHHRSPTPERRFRHKNKDYQTKQPYRDYRHRYQGKYQSNQQQLQHIIQGLNPMKRSMMITNIIVQTFVIDLLKDLIKEKDIPNFIKDQGISIQLGIEIQDFLKTSSRFTHFTIKLIEDRIQQWGKQHETSSQSSHRHRSKSRSRSKQYYRHRNQKNNNNNRHK